MREALAFAVACIAGVAVAEAEGQLSPFAKQKTATFFRDRLPCLGCHRIGGTDGGTIGPDLADVGARRGADYVCRMIRDPAGTVPGTRMPKTPMSPAMLDLLVRFLSGDTPGTAARCGDVGEPAGDAPAPMPAAPATTAVAETLYGRHCAACHGVSGRGDGPNARHLPVPPAAHADPAAMSRRPDDALFDVIAAGGYAGGRSNRMPAYGRMLSRAEIIELVRHIRRLCRCEGPAWSRDGGAATVSPPG